MGKPGLPFLAVLLLAAGWAPRCSAQTIAEAAAESRLAWQTNAPAQHTYTPDAQQQVNLKSPWAASGLSLLLPGTGQFYAGAPGRGKVFLGAEVVIWGMALVFDRQSAWKSDDAIRLAVQHAQLDPEGKDEEFFEYLESYQNRDEYNRAGRIIDPSRPFLPETRENYWQWDSPENRAEYKDTRNESEAASRNRTFTFYAALINRVVSAVDAFRLVARDNARKRERKGLKLSVSPKLSWSNPGVMINARLVF